MSRQATRSQDDHEKSRLGDLMIENGWCPQHVRHLQQVYPTHFLEKFATMNKSIHRDGDHRDCRSERCNFFSIRNPSSYEQYHTTKCQNNHCRNVGIPQDDLLKALRMGEVPLVSCRYDEAIGYTLKIQQRRYGDIYTAISHVWYDGLGNPLSNSLPECQVARLVETLSQASLSGSTQATVPGFVGRFRRSPAILFWMDTFCIPPQECHSDLKFAAIDSMASIYAGSQRVLVLDKELMATNSGIQGLYGMDETMLKIAASVWMTRSWTFQEAVLPQTTVFKFDDRLFDPDSAWGGLDYYHKMCSPGTFLRYQKYTGMARFIYVWNALAGRATTEASDLYIVLATSLNFKLKQFRNFTSSEERMARMFLSYKELPLSILFVLGPRCVERNHWLPSQVSYDLISETRSRIIIDEKEIVKGLDLRLEFHAPTAQSAGDRVAIFIFDEFNRNLMGTTPLVRINLQKFEVRMVSDGMLRRVSESPVARWCVIAETDYQGTRDTLRGALFLVKTTGQPNTLLMTQTTKKDRHTLQYIGPVRLYYNPEAFPSLGPIYDGRHVDDYSADFYLKIDAVPDFEPLKTHSQRSLEMRAPRPGVQNFLTNLTWREIFTAIYAILVAAAIIVPIQWWMYHSLKPKTNIYAYVFPAIGILICQANVVYWSWKWRVPHYMMIPFKIMLRHVVHYVFLHGSFEEKSLMQRLKNFVSPKSWTKRVSRSKVRSNDQRQMQQDRNGITV